MVTHDEGWFQGYEDQRLYYQSWRGEDLAQAGMVIVHGAGDHSGRFDRIVQPVVQSGIAVFAFDLRGFGRSPGKKGHINAWEEYRSDLRLCVDVVRGQVNGAPIFLFGYSLGAAIVLDFILRIPEAGICGAILSGTPIDPVGVATSVEIRLAHLLSRIWPGFTIRRTSDIQGVSRDPAVLEALKVDPLHHDLVTARWGTEAMAVMDWIRTQADRVRLPVLFIHGEADPYNTVRGVQRFFDQVTYPDKMLKVYPGSHHETHNDLDHARVASDLIDWMQAHC